MDRTRPDVQPVRRDGGHSRTGEGESARIREPGEPGSAWGSKPQGPAVQTFRVTVNNFMATGGDGFAVLVGGTNALGGAQDIDALLAYFAQFKAPNAPYDLAAVPNRITQIP